MVELAIKKNEKEALYHGKIKSYIKVKNKKVKKSY